MITPSRRFLPLAATVAAALCLPPAACRVAAQSGTTLQRAYAIGGTRARTKPYSFTGKIYDDFGNGSGTLLRRHTVLTAAHVVFEPGAGFVTATTFDRALYGNKRLSTSRALAVAALSGYQEASVLGVTTASGSRDLGYLVLIQPSVDEDYAPYARQKSPVFKANNLTDDSGRFILGYPGAPFDNRTMAYIVPTAPFVEVAPGYYRNFDYITISGMSGGPVYSVINGVQTVVGEVTDSTITNDVAFNASDIRAIDKEADRFLVSAEYTNGLIQGTTITPADTTAYPVDATKNQITVALGAVVNFNTAVVFSTPNAAGNTATTTRYTELTLTSDFATTLPVGANPVPLVSIVKTGNNQFQVTFTGGARGLRPNTVVNLQVQYAKNTNAPSAPVPTNATTGLPTGPSPAPSTLRVLVK